MTKAASITERAMTARATSRCQLCERLIRPGAEMSGSAPPATGCTPDASGACSSTHNKQPRSERPGGAQRKEHSHGPQKRTPNDRDLSPRIGLLPHPSDRPCGLAGCN
jgi:hypothetical protein